jgi:DnaJ like chaperone protein
MFQFLYHIQLLTGPQIGTIMFLSIFCMGITFLLVMHSHLNLLQSGDFPWYWRANTKSYVELFTRLAATMISKETSHSREKIKFLHQTIHQYFPNVNFDYRNSIVFTYRFPIYVKSYTTWISKRMSMAERLKLIQFLIALAAIDGKIGEREYEFIKRIASNINISIQEIDDIVNMHKNRFEEEQKSKREEQHPTVSSVELILLKFGLTKNATWQNVKQAYRSLAKKCHPDVFNQAHETLRKQKHIEFLELQRDYAFLEERMLN